MKKLILQATVFAAAMLACGYVWSCDAYEFDRDFEVQIARDHYAMCLVGEFDDTPVQECLGIFMDDMATIDAMEKEYR